MLNTGAAKFGAKELKYKVVVYLLVTHKAKETLLKLCMYYGFNCI